MNKTMKIYRLALFEYGENDGGTRWFSLLPLHWGTDLIFQEYGALIEIAWRGRDIIYVEWLWDLSQALRLARYYFRAGEPLDVAMRHSFRNIYKRMVG